MQLQQWIEGARGSRAASTALVRGSPPVRAGQQVAQAQPRSRQAPAGWAAAWMPQHQQRLHWGLCYQHRPLGGCRAMGGPWTLLMHGALAALLPQMALAAAELPPSVSHLQAACALPVQLCCRLLGAPAMLLQPRVRLLAVAALQLRQQVLVRTSAVLCWLLPAGHLWRPDPLC